MEEKIKLIYENKKVFIAALNAYLDRIYELTDSFIEIDENGNSQLKLGLTPDENAENFIKELREDAKNYENVRAKIIRDDINLSLSEINYAALSIIYMDNLWAKQIETLTSAKEEAAKLIKILMEEKS